MTTAVEPTSTPLVPGTTGTAPRVGVLFGQQVDDLEPLVDLARLCADRGARLWLGQSMILESHLALAAVAGRGISVATGLGVAVAPLTTPSFAWAQASSVARLTNRSVTACYGFGSLAAAEALRGAPMPAPARWMRRFVADVAAQRDTARDQGTAPQADVELGCGVLRPTMARHAGAVSDAVVTWLTPTSHLAEAVVPALGAGAASAGRPAPRVVSIVPCALRRPGREPVRLAATAVGQHIRLPHYAAMLRGAGVDLRGEPAHDLRATLRTGLFTYGTADDVAAVVLDHVAAGSDEVVLHAGSVGLAHGCDAALDDVREVIDALGVHARPVGRPAPVRPAPATER